MKDKKSESEETESAWSMTDTRRNKMAEAVKDVQDYIHSENPKFEKMQGLLDKLNFEHETARNG